MMEYMGALGYGSVRCAVRVCGGSSEAKGLGRKVRRWGEGL